MASATVPVAAGAVAMRQFAPATARAAQSPAPRPRTANAQVSIEIGRIEIKTVPSASPAAPDHRRVTMARPHAIDPGLRFGDGRGW